MACVDAIGQAESVFCLCCSRSFLQAELPGHVTNDHFGFLPFACTSCDFTAASEREVLEHAKEKRHIPYVADHSSAKPYLSLLVRLVVSHCKTFARTDDFAAILAELTAQIAAHENGFSEMKLQREFGFVDNPLQQLDSESSSERSVSTPRSAQNGALRLRGEPQYGGVHIDLVNSNYSLSPQSTVGVGASATLKRKTKLLKQPTSALAAPHSSDTLSEQVKGSSNKRANAGVNCALCPTNGDLFSEQEKEQHVMQHLELRSEFGSAPERPEAFFTEIAAMWQHCFPALDECAVVVEEMPVAALEGVARRQGHVTGSVSTDFNGCIVQQSGFPLRKLPQPDEEGAVREETDRNDRRYPARRSSLVNAADIIASNQLATSPKEVVNRRGKRNDTTSSLETTQSTHYAENSGRRTLFCRVCDRVLLKNARAVCHVWRHHMADNKQFTCSVCEAEHNSRSQLRIGCQARHPTITPIMKESSGDIRKMFALRYRQCFARNPNNQSAGRHSTKPSRDSGSSSKPPASSHLQNAAAQRRLSAALAAGASIYECQICSDTVIAKTYSLKYHAMHKHFTAPQKVFECSKCGFGNNEWRCHVVQHVKKVHRGQKGKGVRVIDRSAKFAKKIHACLKSCFPEAEFAPPRSKVAPKKIDGYHAVDPGVVAAGHSSENPPEFDLPGSSGYDDSLELDPSQELEDAMRPLVDGFDESDEDESFVNVAVKAEQIK